MKEWLSKKLGEGLELALLTRDKLEEYARKAAAEARLTGQEAQKFIEEMKEKAEKARTDLQERIDEGVKKAIDSAGLVRKEELEALTKRVEELEKKLKKTTTRKKKSTTTRKSTKTAKKEEQE